MKAQSTGKKYITGFSTLEILISFSIVILCIGAVIMVTFGNQSLTVDSQTNNEAISKAQALLEKARADARNDFALLNPIDAHQDPGSIYTQSLNVVTQPNFFTKNITSNITWQLGGRTLNTVLSTVVTNPNGVVDNNICNSVLTNPTGWKNPNHYDKPTTDIVDEATGNNSDGLGVTSLNVFENKLYMTVDNPPNNHHNLWVNNLPTDPVDWPTYNGYLGSVDTNKVGVNDGSGGLKAITVAKIGTKAYAFIANSEGVSTKGQLQVVDLTNPVTSGWNPSKKFYPLPTVASSKLGNSIFYSKKFTYLGLTGTSDSGTEFNIIDVSTPLSPSRIGGYSTGGHTINSIYVKGDYAYIATPQNESAPNSDEIITVVDVRVGSPTFAKRVGGWSDLDYPPGGPTNHGKSLFVVGNQIYLGRTYGTNELQVLSKSSSNNVNRIGKQDTGSASVYGIGVKDYLAFLFTKTQFQVWNLKDLNNITPWTMSGTTNEFNDSNHDLNSYGGEATVGFSCVGDYFYAAITPSNNKEYISIITPGLPTPTLSLRIHNTSHTSISTANTGDVVHAEAIVTTTGPTPTGTVNFTFYTNGTCSSGNSSAGNISLSGGTAHPSNNKTPTNPGSYSFKARYNGDSNYSSLDSSCVKLAVKANQTITFNSLPNKTISDPDFTLSATSSSGLSVSFTSQTTPVCTVSGITVHIVSTGICTIRASQDGNVDYNPAPNIDQSFTVNSQPFTYTLSNVSDFTVTKGLPATTITVTVTRTGGTGQLVTLTPPKPDLNITITTTPLNTFSCTPSPTCQITFNYSYSGTTNQVYNSQQVTGSPNAMTTNGFKITLKK